MESPLGRKSQDRYPRYMALAECKAPLWMAQKSGEMDWVPTWGVLVDMRTIWVYLYKLSLNYDDSNYC